jgi:outer membrane receptor protein involved in Fe transport
LKNAENRHNFLRSNELEAIYVARDVCRQDDGVPFDVFLVPNSLLNKFRFAKSRAAVESGIMRVNLQKELLSICFHSCLIFFCAAPVLAQNISGIVADAQNAPIENATVSLANQNKVVSQTRTDREGKFSFPAGNQTNLFLKIAADGFAPFEKRLSENDFGGELKIVLEPQNLRADVTVSVAQTETRLSETPASVVVLTRENLETTAAPTVDDALRQIAGFNLFRRSSSRTTNPTAQGANFRGLAGSGAARASVLLDGVSVNDAFGGWTYWSRIPRSSLEQAEVLRGGASALYGDAALSGAVNLRTKSFADEPVFRLATSAGTQKTFDASAFGAIGKNGWSVLSSFDTFQTGGYIPVAEEERGAADARANSRYQNGFLTVEKRFSTQRRGDAEIFQNGRIFLRGNYFAERRDNGTRLTDNQTRFRQLSGGADFTVENVGAFQIRAFVEKQIYDQTFSAISNNRNAETLSRVQRVPSQSAGANLNWSRSFGDHFVSAASDFREVRGASDETIFQNNRAASIVGAGGRERAAALSAQDFWRVSDKLNFSFGARFETWKNFDAFSATRNLTTNQTQTNVFPPRRETAFSPRLAALYQINQNFSLYGSFAKSFRAPTLNELYRAFRVGNVLTLANENLKAERADTFEGGLNFIGAKRKLNLRGNLFFTRVARPVVSVTLTSAPNLITRQRQNVGATRAVGFELDGEFLVRKNWRVSASYLFVDSRVADFPANPVLVDKFLPQVARRQFAFQSLYRLSARLALALQGRFSGAQFEDDLNALKLRPLATFDAFASYKFPKRFEIFMAIENVFGNRYDIGLTPNRTVAAPRFVRAGLRFDLKNK